MRGVEYLGRDAAESQTPRRIEPTPAHGQQRSLLVLAGRLQQGCCGLAHGDPDPRPERSGGGVPDLLSPAFEGPLFPSQFVVHPPRIELALLGVGLR